MTTGDKKKGTVNAIGVWLSLYRQKIVTEASQYRKREIILRLDKESLNAIAKIGDGFDDAVALAAADAGVLLSGGVDLVLIAI